MSSGINAFDRVVINPRERPVSSDINALQSRLDQSLREVMRALSLPHDALAGRAGHGLFTPAQGFIGDGFFATADGSSRTVTLNPGLGFLLGTAASNFGSISGLDDLGPNSGNTFFPVYLPAPLIVAIDAVPSSGQERYDIIEVAQDRRVENPSSRDILNPATGLFEASLVNKTFAYMLDSSRLGRVVSPAASTTGIGYKVGVAATIGSAAIPTATAGYTIVAVVYSVDSAAQVRQQDIRDDRKLLLPAGHESFAFLIQQTDGSPDVVTVSWLAANAGVRVAARMISSPGGSIKVAIFGGGLVALPTVQIFAAAGTSDFTMAKLYTAGSTTRLTQTEMNNLLPQVQAFGESTGTKGQSYYTFQIDRHVVSGADPSPRVYAVTGSFVSQP
jgi:hypothetical protein